MECALSQNDDRLVRVLNCDDFVLKGVYHNGCMTKYLLKSSPKNEQKQDSDLSSNEIAFQNLIHEINDDLVVHKKVFRMTQLLEKYKAYLPADTGTYSSAKAKRAAMKRDEEHVQLLIDHLRERMTDPFEVEEHPEALINISTAMHASREIEISLLDAVEDGKQMANSFIKKTLEVGNNGNFYSPIPHSKIKTFEDMTKKTKLKCCSGEVMTVQINPEVVF